MIRQFLIALGVMTLELGYQGIGLALDCPKQPEQISKDWEGEVNAAVAKIGRVSGIELKLKAKQATQDLLEKASEKERDHLEIMMYAAYCSALQDDKTSSKSEIAQK